MSEIVTYDSDTEALKWRPYRAGFEYKLYYHTKTKLYQWINDPRFAERFGMIRVFPDADPVLGGFGLAPFGLAPFGR